MNNYAIVYSDTLAHHGVKGMKWGVWNEETSRRYVGGSGLNKNFGSANFKKVKLSEYRKEKEKVVTKVENRLKKKYNKELEDLKALGKKYGLDQQGNPIWNKDEKTLKASVEYKLKVSMLENRLQKDVEKGKEEVRKELVKTYGEKDVNSAEFKEAAQTFFIAAGLVTAIYAYPIYLMYNY